MESERLLSEAEASDDPTTKVDVEVAPAAWGSTSAEGDGSAASSGRDGGGAEGVEPLGWNLVFSYGLGHILNDLSASIWFFYAVLFSQQVLDLSEKLTGGVILIGQTGESVPPRPVPSLSLPPSLTSLH